MFLVGTKRRQNMKNLIIVVVILAALSYGGSKLLLHNKVGKGVDQAVIAMSPFVNVKYDGVSSTMGGELTIDGIEARINGFNDPITIDRLGIDTPSYFSLLKLADIADNMTNPDDAMPEYFGFIVEDMRMSVDADYFKEYYDVLQQPPGAAGAAEASDAAEPAAVCAGKYGFSPEALRELGYIEQVMSISVHVRREPSSFSMLVKSSVRDMGAIEAEFTLSGGLTSQLSQGARARPKMSEMRMEFIDLSLNDRVADYCARLGLSSEQIVAAQLDKLSYYGEALGIEFDEYVLAPYTEFVGGKSKLVITAKPNTPISIDQISLYKPSDVPALLNLTAEAF
jgi:hypothetical protein